MKFPDFIFLGNNIRDIILVAAIITFMAFFRRWLSGNLASLIFIYVRKKWKSVNKKEFTGLTIKPLSRFLAVLVSILAIHHLYFPKAFAFSIYGVESIDLLRDLGKCLILVYFIWVIQSFIDFIALVLDLNARANKDKRDDQLIVFFRDFSKAIIYVIGLMFVLKIGFGVDVGALLTGLSIVGAALALAAKESIENLIASFIIFFDKPFFTGDLVKLNAVTGTVEHIGLRSTRIRTNEQTLVTVPNKQMVDGIVDNWSMRSSRRAEMKIEFSHSNKSFSIEQFMSAMSKFLEGKKPVISKHTVYITDISKNNLTVMIEYFTIPFAMEDFLSLKQETALFIKATIESNQLKLATVAPDINIFNTDTGSSGIVSTPII